MEALVISETHYLQTVLQEALGMTSDSFQFDIHFVVKQDRWKLQVQRFRQCYPLIGRVVLLRKTWETLPPDHYCVENAADLSAVLGIQMTPGVRNKLNSRVFGHQNSPSVPLQHIPMEIHFAEMAPPVTESSKSRFKEPEEGDDCAICMAYKATILFVPCSHQTTCDECARRILETSGQCPMCRQPVSDVFRPIKN